MAIHTLMKNFPTCLQRENGTCIVINFEPGASRQFTTGISHDNGYSVNNRCFWSTLKEATDDAKSLGLTMQHDTIQAALGRFLCHKSTEADGRVLVEERRAAERGERE